MDDVAHIRDVTTRCHGDSVACVGGTWKESTCSEDCEVKSREDTRGRVALTITYSWSRCATCCRPVGVEVCWIPIFRKNRGVAE